MDQKAQIKLIAEKELEEIMAGYQTVEPKSEPFERMAETLRVLWKVTRAAEEHSVSCQEVEDDFHAVVDELHERQ